MAKSIEPWVIGQYIGGPKDGLSSAYRPDLDSDGICFDTYAEDPDYPEVVLSSCYVYRPDKDNPKRLIYEGVRS